MCFGQQEQNQQHVNGAKSRRKPKWCGWIKPVRRMEQAKETQARRSQLGPNVGPHHKAQTKGRANHCKVFGAFFEWCYVSNYGLSHRKIATCNTIKCSTQK